MIDTVLPGNCQIHTAEVGGSIPTSPLNQLLPAHPSSATPFSGEADRRKDEFLATLAHELRNPLAPIRNSLAILELTGGLGPAAERIREMMERQVNHMVRLVDDLLEISRISRGTIELRKERIELATMVRGAVEISTPLIEAGRHQLAITLPPEAVTLDGDFGAEVHLVNDGPSALESLSIFKPHVVLLDIGMLEMNGYEVARQIRQQHEFRRVPLVALTGWGQEEDRRRTSEAGFQHHLVKPVALDTLQALLLSLEGRGAELLRRCGESDLG